MNADNEGKEKMKMVITGHVDHGKSTLVGRLLYDTNSLPEGRLAEIKRTCDALGRPLEFAYLLDYLEEEREQGITIDTTQIFFATPKRDYVIIDAPGHKEFLKNMITGASQAEAGVIIVDVKEGLREQTKRHAYLLSLLGLKQVIVVLNKMDLVEFDEGRFASVKSEAEAFLRNLSVKPFYWIPISASEGDNVAKKSPKMPWYDGPTLLGALDSFKTAAHATDKPLRLPIQAMYFVDGKRIFAGRIEAGSLRAGDEIAVLPRGVRTRVKTIEAFNAKKTEAQAGESIGFTTEDEVFIERGNVVCPAGREAGERPSVAKQFKASVFWMSPKPLSASEKLVLKLATQELDVRIKRIEKRLNSSSLELIEENASALEETEVGEMVLSTTDPVVAECFNDSQEMGRFVLERGNDVSAGGVVTEVIEE